MRYKFEVSHNAAKTTKIFVEQKVTARMIKVYLLDDLKKKFSRLARTSIIRLRTNKSKTIDSDVVLLVLQTNTARRFSVVHHYHYLYKSIWSSRIVTY